MNVDRRCRKGEEAVIDLFVSTAYPTNIKMNGTCCTAQLSIEGEHTTSCCRPGGLVVSSTSLRHPLTSSRAMSWRCQEGSRAIKNFDGVRREGAEQRRREICVRSVHGCERHAVRKPSEARKKANCREYTAV